MPKPTIGGGVSPSAASCGDDPQASLIDHMSEEKVLATVGPSWDENRVRADADTAEVDRGEDRRSPADQLVELGLAADLFHSKGGDPYAGLTVNGHLETWHLRSRGFARWLRHQFFTAYSKAPSIQALQTALGTLEARAHFDGPERPVFLRIGQHEDRVYLDLGNEAWDAVEIRADMWKVVPRPPVHFRRPRGIASLPYPAPEGILTELREFINVADTDWPLAAAWLVAALRPAGPYPILILQGEQGSAKSTMARVLRALVDPSTASLGATPRDERDLAIAANNSWVLSFDNLSRIGVALSDALCRLATGGGFRTRELYTDAEEVIFDAQRPVILNGIEELAERDDLRERSLILTLPALPQGRRLDEESLWNRFAAAHPRLLGALLAAVSAGIRNLPEIRLAALPRMADFARWGMAAEPGLKLPRGAFMRAYAENRERAVELTVEFDMVAQTIRDLATKGPWRGTATQLLKDLKDQVPDQLAADRQWPKAPHVLSNRIKRVAPALRQLGTNVEFEREARRRLIVINQAGSDTVTTVMGVTGQAGNDEVGVSDSSLTAHDQSLEALKGSIVNHGNDADDDGDADVSAGRGTDDDVPV